MKSLCTRSLRAGSLAIFVAGALWSVSSPAVAQDRSIRECEAQGAGDISMDARYEVRGARKKFSVEFEAAPNGAFRAGQRIFFFVAGVNVGSDALEPIVGGDLVGEINLDTQAGAGDDEDPFPANFPTVGQGTRVAVRTRTDLILACRLR